MHRRWFASGMAMWAGLFATAAAAAEPPAAIVRADEPGPQRPAVGRSLFDELFATPTGYDLPYPFARLLDAIDARLQSGRARTALIPLGRSLQRYAADPDYFASPRVIVAVDAEGVSSGEEPLLRDRLFLGYQPAAEAIEVISYNEAAGRFEFQEVTGYADGLAPQVTYAAREICIPCHQGHGPIFARPLWTETNATPAVAERLAALGASFHGASVRQSIDELDALDRATDRATQIAVANRLWDEGCGAGSAGRACRAGLLAATLHFRLAGARPEWRPLGMERQAAALQEHLRRLWPGGLATPNPDLPNRDPLAELDATGSLEAVLEPTGAMDPRTPRPDLVHWQPSAEPAATFASVARSLAGMFAAADIHWLDALLVARGGTEGRREAPCRLERLQLGQDRQELRADCESDDVTLSGFVTITGGRVTGGRIDRLSIDRAPEVRQLRVSGGSLERNGAVEVVRLTTREAASGLSTRLLSGVRITEIVLTSGPSEASAGIGMVDDLAELDRAVGDLSDGDALGPGPLRRRMILGSLGRALTM